MLSLAASNSSSDNVWPGWATRRYAFSISSRLISRPSTTAHVSAETAAGAAGDPGIDPHAASDMASAHGATRVKPRLGKVGANFTQDISSKLTLSVLQGACTTSRSACGLLEAITRRLPVAR